MRQVLTFFIFVIVHHNLLAQLGKTDLGLSKPGLDDLRSAIVGRAETQKCFLPGSCRDNCAVYVFTGSGNWDEETNWQEENIPPLTPGNCAIIIINPAGNTECIMNIPRRVLPKGSTITVKAGKRFRIPGDVQKQ